MKALHWLASPLTATAAVMAGLALLSLPLLRLTSAAPEPAPTAMMDDAVETNAVLRLRTLVPLREIVITDANGGTLLRLQDAPAGESEHDVTLQITHGGLDLDLAVAGAPVETAVFLTVIPDGREELTRHAIGEGDISDILRYDWPHAD